MECWEESRVKFIGFIIMKMGRESEGEVSKEKQ